MMYKVTIFERYTQQNSVFPHYYYVVMMYKVTIFERYTQLIIVISDSSSCCYDVQSYNFWKIYTTISASTLRQWMLLWCTKLQFLKDIHNLWFSVLLYRPVVMMYKVTIFERYTQLTLPKSFIQVCCYDVQSYNFWKIYTTSLQITNLINRLLWCTKLQFLKDIHNREGI